MSDWGQVSVVAFDLGINRSGSVFLNELSSRCSHFKKCVLSLLTLY